MKLLFIGDIVGEPGRRAVKQLVPRLIADHGIDLVVANGENAAGGSGITQSTAAEIYAAGVDVITTGDHLWDHKEVIDLLVSERRFVRPINYPPNTPGQGSTIVSTAKGVQVGIVNVQGRTFMADLENPFVAMQQEINHLRRMTPVIFVDIHAEATSEKIAMGRMLDGQVSAVVGTHTHVQTADEQIFPRGTAFLCDAGFTGPHDSVIGRDVDAVVKRFFTSQPQRFAVSTGKILLQGALIDIDEASGQARSIQRISEPLTGYTNGIGREH